MVSIITNMQTTKDCWRRPTYETRSIICSRQRYEKTLREVMSMSVDCHAHPLTSLMPSRAMIEEALVRSKGKSNWQPPI